MQQATLCIIVQGQPVRQVLLGYKKIGFGQGKYTGFGGKVEPGETVEAAARRELVEETGINAPLEQLHPSGVLAFIFPNKPAWDQEVHVFRVAYWQGEPVETKEMKPQWFDIHELPFTRMWDDCRYWLPSVLSDQLVTAEFIFKDDNATVDHVAIDHAESSLYSTLSPKPFSITPLLISTLNARAHLLLDDLQHETVMRLFNGFLEGCPEIGVDLYADTLVLYNHASPTQKGKFLIQEAQAFYLNRLPWINCVIIKTRNANNKEIFNKRGVITFGNNPACRIREHGVWYALNLLLHQDGTFYPDTRNLRHWAIDHLANKKILNTFAYTGSLGVAALAGGARQVVQLDRNYTYLNIAKTSYTLNGFAIQPGQFLVGDFFPRISALKREGVLFDCIFLDPPFLSITTKGRVDLVSQNTRLINKVHPLISDRGWLVTVNNALFVSGADYLRMLEGLCSEGYLSIEELIPIPPDCAGYPETRLRALPVDPAPFNHATKIVVLRVKKKIP